VIAITNIGKQSETLSDITGEPTQPEL